MEKGKSWLKLVDSKPTKPKTAYAGDPLRCRKCDSSATIEVRLGRTVRNGKVSAGQKQYRCAQCGAVLWG